MLVSKYFQIVTLESLENGDFAEQGAIFEDVEMTFREALREVRADYWEWSSNPPQLGSWLATTEPTMNRDLIERGVERYYTLHFKNLTEEEFAALLVEVENQ